MQVVTAKAIYVNLPIKDIKKTRDFWTKTGFGFNELFSNDQALSLVLNEGSMYAMLISPEHFSSFTNKPIADGSTTQLLVAIEVETKNEVDKIVRLALENGATRFKPAVDLGWMYYDSFEDIDSHQWEVLNIDYTQIPK